MMMERAQHRGWCEGGRAWKARPQPGALTPWPRMWRWRAEVQGPHHRIDDVTDRVEQGLVAVHHHSDEVASPLVQRMDATNAHLAQCIDTGDARPTQ